MSSAAAAPRAAVPFSPARAEASRRNGAKSRRPKTLEGKARSSQNALKHGLRAQQCVVLPCETGETPGGGDHPLREHGLQRALGRRFLEQRRLERLELGGTPAAASGSP